MDVKRITTSARQQRGEGSSVQFDVIVFHRENDITVVAILPRGESSPSASMVRRTSDSGIPAVTLQFQGLVAAFMGGMLSNMGNSDAARDFWWEAMETQLPGRPNPASSKVIESLPTNHIQPLERILSDRCTVCQENYKIGDKITNLPCGHCFHKDCLVPWLRQRNTCPLCRFKLKTEDEKLETQKDEESSAISSERKQHVTSSEADLQPRPAWNEAKTSESKLFSSTVTSSSRASSSRRRRR